MLSREENELLTRTGRGTPAGELLRRYWQPVALLQELPKGGAPLPVRIFGEDLVLFRPDAAGGKHQEQPGLLGLHCSHRGADLSYGRLEDGGLRCIYHGWLYDVQGRCLEQPGEPPGSTFHDRIQHLAYPCREVGSLILTYMGPGEPPLIPAYDFLRAPRGYQAASKIFHECNYLQGNEGNIDPAHNAFLHGRIGRESDRSPSIEPEETEFGLHIRRVRQVTPSKTVLSTSNFILPNLTAFPGGGENDGYSVNWHVPIDDEHHWKYAVRFRRDAPLDQDGYWQGLSEITDDYRPIRNKTNRYLQDREEMWEYSFSGLGDGFQAQDACAVEGAGPIQDRTHEHLGSSDRAIMAARKLLLRAILDLQEGREPKNVVRDPARNRFPGLVVNTTVVADQTEAGR